MENISNLTIIYNFKINLEPESLRTYENSDMEYVNEEVYFVHYSGKFKPWTVRGALHFSSKYYQNYYKNIIFQLSH